MRTIAFVTASTLAVTLLIGNLAIVAASAWARSTVASTAIEGVRGVDNLERVDRSLWRGSAPTEEGYRALARRGVRTVIDLRAEHGLQDNHAFVRRLGLRLVPIPIRDGQTPSAAEVHRFLGVVEASPGLTFVHCGAGVGRTGTMAAAYLVERGTEDPSQALRRNLAVGPPSLEQVAFVRDLGDGRFRRPSALVTGLSRVLDAPRRLWSRLGP